MLRTSLPALLVATLLILAGCSENPLGNNVSDPDTAPARSIGTAEAEAYSILRNPQFLEAAQAPAPDVAWGKGNGQGRGVGNGNGNGTPGEDPVTITPPDLYALIGYNGVEPDGVTRRVIDAYAVTRRVLEEYGVSRRVLEEYGVSRRVLEEYGVTRRVLDEFGISRRVLEEYGISRRILDEYGVTMDEFEAQLAAYDPAMKIRTATDGTISVWIRGRNVTSILLEMADDPDISFVEPDPEAEVGSLGTTVFRNANQGQYLPWGMDRIDSRLATLQDAVGTHVFVLDSGMINYDLRVATRKDFTMLFLNRDQMLHEDTEWTNPGFFDPGTDGNPEDENGHGSHVGGIIGGIDNTIGVRGVAAGVTLHSLKVLTAEGRTDMTTLVAAINYVIHKARELQADGDRVVINLSLGMDVGSTAMNALDETVQQAIDEGIVVVVSAGNNGADASTYSPAHVAGAITVGATTTANEFATFSNRGSLVDLLAPGQDIVSLPRTQAEVDAMNFVVQSGTSMAAPHVSAAAALYLALHPTATPAEVEAGLKAHAETGISAVPSGTTDRIVSVRFAQDFSREAPFSLSRARWNARNGKMTIEGYGPRKATVELYSEATGTALGSLMIPMDEQWFGYFNEVLKPQIIPCRVRGSWNGESAIIDLEGAPANCEGASSTDTSNTGSADASTTSDTQPALVPLTVSEAFYKSRGGQFKIEGEAPPNSTLTMTAGESGDFYSLVTVRSDSSWLFMDRKPDWYPCTVALTDGSQSVTAEVSGAVAGECRK